MTTIKRALLSVSDKTGIVDFARQLQALDIALLSTGGTHRLLEQHHIAVTEVSAHTGFPEIMDGRVKTLHPKIHAGLLGRRGQDAKVMQQHDIAPIDLLVVNLYPFEQTVGRSDCTLAEAVENIDIGGPAMVRSAAKNYPHVGVIVDVEDYSVVLAELQDKANQLSAERRFTLARKAFAHTANYDANISNYLGAQASDDDDIYPETFTSQFHKVATLRYGENPHQSAACYREPSPASGTLAAARQIQGKALSYNNIADADAALECVLSFAAPACVIFKHANPCGVAVAETIEAAYQMACNADPISAFGGIIAFNRTLDEATIRAVFARQFAEVILAPDIAAEARKAAAAKNTVRLLATGQRTVPLRQLELKRVSGGLLLQDGDTGRIEAADLNTVSQREPTAAELNDLMFAWRVVKYVKSNAIVYARDQHSIGIGAGQMSRIDSAKVAAMKAADSGHDLTGSVMASDAFFPFRDGVDVAAAAGVVAVIHPGGSVNDEAVIAAANEHGMAMVLTGMRHFRH